MQQQLFNDNIPNSTNILTEILKKLPELPSTVRYLDDFDDEIRTLKGFNFAEEYRIHVNGSIVIINLIEHDVKVSELIKHLIVAWIAEGLTPNTICTYCNGLKKVSYIDFCSIINAGPLKIIKLWTELISTRQWTKDTFNGLKKLMFFLAKYNLVGWSNSYNAFISKNLRGQHVDKYASVTKGDVFLSIAEESKIVNFLDNIVLLIHKQEIGIDFEKLSEAGMLVCNYQFGMRPAQIALLTMLDIRVWDESSSGTSLAVHLTFKTIKQRTKFSSKSLLRKVKQEWAPIFTAIYKRNQQELVIGNSKFFRINSSDKVIRNLGLLANQIVGREISTTSTDIRHTSAQRMADGGASQEELAEFMGHSDITTCLVYFQTSANQAERVNQALGVSPIYQQVVKIAHDKFISKEDLIRLKGAHQIAAVPHGIPIAGIGACSSGQPACPFNPVTSCYGCRKFMPLNNATIHEQVLKDMRDVVGFFITESKGDPTSPTYLQLQNTISGVQQIISEIEGANHA